MRKWQLPNKEHKNNNNEIISKKYLRIQSICEQHNQGTKYNLFIEILSPMEW